MLSHLKYFYDNNEKDDSKMDNTKSTIIIEHLTGTRYCVKVLDYLMRTKNRGILSLLPSFVT